jgi:hypothetical protein
MYTEDALPLKRLDEYGPTTKEENQLIRPWPMSNVRDREFPAKLDGDYLIYSVREGHNYLWLSGDIYISTQFNEEQRQHMISSARLLLFNFPSDSYAIARIARNDPRDNDTYPFLGRLPGEGGIRTTVERLRAARNSDRKSGEAGAILLAIYTEMRSGLAESAPGPFKLYIDRMDVAPNGNTWKLGEAEVNYYHNNSNVYRIKLNSLAIGSQSAYSNRLDRLTWAGVNTARNAAQHGLEA